MKQFKDAKERTWDIVVNVGTAKAVKDACDVNIFEAFQAETQRLFSDPCLLVDVIFVLCRDQAKERGVTDVDFGKAMVGDALEDAAKAFMSEVADFFPNARRSILRAQMEKAETIATQLHKKTMEKIESLDVQSLLSSMK